MKIKSIRIFEGYKVKYIGIIAKICSILRVSHLLFVMILC